MSTDCRLSYSIRALCCFHITQITLLPSLWAVSEIKKLFTCLCLFDVWLNDHQREAETQIYSTEAQNKDSLWTGVYSDSLVNVFSYFHHWSLSDRQWTDSLIKVKNNGGWKTSQNDDEIVKKSCFHNEVWFYWASDFSPEDGSSVFVASEYLMEKYWLLMTPQQTHIDTYLWCVISH